MADGPGPDAWGYQSCTETLHEFSSRGLRDFAFDLERDGNAKCAEVFGLSEGAQQAVTVPNPRALARRFGGYALGDGLAVGLTNLVWSNGLLDPWSGGGFLAPPAFANDTGNVWVAMPSGAHHLDLRGPHPDDPPDVIAARATEELVIRGWIDDFAARSAAVLQRAKTP